MQPLPLPPTHPPLPTPSAHCHAGTLPATLRTARWGPACWRWSCTLATCCTCHVAPVSCRVAAGGVGMRGRCTRRAGLVLYTAEHLFVLALPPTCSAPGGEPARQPLPPPHNLCQPAALMGRCGWRAAACGACSSLPVLCCWFRLHACSLQPAVLRLPRCLCPHRFWRRRCPRRRARPRLAPCLPQNQLPRLASSQRACPAVTLPAVNQFSAVVHPQCSWKKRCPRRCAWRHRTRWRCGARCHATTWCGLVAAAAAAATAVVAGTAASAAAAAWPAS